MWGSCWTCKVPITSISLRSGIGGLIAEKEAEVSAFFKSQEPGPLAGKWAKKIHAQFQKQHSLDFIIKEGSLKRDLLLSGTFSDPEIEYFQTSGIGSIAFCQCAEVFMNGFKFGHAAASYGSAFSKDKYFSLLSSKAASFTPKAKSVVYYPPQYSKIYSLDGSFAHMLKGVFSLQGNWDAKNKITTWVVGGKE